MIALAQFITTRRRQRSPYLLCIACIAVLFTLLLAGCGEAEFSSTFERDGSGEHALAFTVPRAAFEEAVQDEQAASTLDLIYDQAAEGGLRAERVLTMDEITLRITTIDEPQEETGAVLNSLLNASGINANPGISAPFQGNFRRESGAVGGNRFILDMTVDGPELYNSMDVLSARVRQTTEPEEIRSNIAIVYQATFPGDVTETNGDLIDDRTVRWTIPADRETTLRAESRLAGSGSAALFIAAGLASLIAVMVLAAIIAILLIRRGGLTARLTAATRDFPRHTTITREGVWVTRRIRRYIDHLHRRSGTERPGVSEMETTETSEERY